MTGTNKKHLGARAATILAALAAAVLLLSSALLWAPDAAPAQTTSACVPPPSGLAAWWQWEGNGTESRNGNTATLFNGPTSGPGTFGPGKVGQALQFDGLNDFAKAPASSSLNVGSGSGLTIEAWIKPSDSNGRPLVEWNNATGGVGTHLWPSFDYSGGLYANLRDTTGVDHVLRGMTTSGFSTTAYQHVALTYDKTSGAARLWRNGAIIGGATPGTFTPQTGYDLYLGRRASGNFQNLFYMGWLDELSLYDRALADTEIRAIFNAGSAGKCPIDTTAPLVSSVFPVKAATNVPRNIQPTATFSEGMRPDTFTTANVKMYNQSTRKRVPVRVSCNDPCATVTIDPYPSDPSKLLVKRTKYKVVILGGAGGPQNLEGIPLAKSEVWTFTTGRR